MTYYLPIDKCQHITKGNLIGQRMQVLVLQQQTNEGVKDAQHGSRVVAMNCIVQTK